MLQLIFSLRLMSSHKTPSLFFEKIGNENTINREGVR